MINEEIARFFNDTRAFIQPARRVRDADRGNPNLRDPQVEGWFRTRQHFRNSCEHTILQIPVGCGKTFLLLQFLSESAKRKARCLFITFAEPEETDPAKHRCLWLGFARHHDCEFFKDHAGESDQRRVHRLCARRGGNRARLEAHSPGPGSAWPGAAGD